MTRLATVVADRDRLDRELGQRRMATVYLAHELKHERDVTMKMLHPELGAAFRGERFLSAIRTTVRLQHPYILALLDSGEADRLLDYVMPLVAAYRASHRPRPGAPAGCPSRYTTSPRDSVSSGQPRIRRPSYGV